MCVVSCTLLLGALVPVSVDAQFRGSSYRTKINRLDEDVVKNLHIPVLFGVRLNVLSKNFADPRDGGDRSHEGLDIMAPEGAPIISPTEAVVTGTGTGGSSGKYVRTANPGGETFVYMHLSEILVRSGDELDEGDIIGYVGNTGNASGGPPHLHFEVREGRTATDPFPRITREFSLEDKIEFLDTALNDVDDEDELVAFVVENYAGELWQAKNAGIELPRDVENALENITMAPSGGSAGAMPTGDLDIGAQGVLVSALQGFLIVKDSGSAARALGAVGATGYFGALTQSALAEYQAAHGIAPAVGYFGPITRAYILANE